MPISVRCSKCGHGYQLRDELAGKQAKCRCGQTLSIPVATPLTSLLDEEQIGAPPDAIDPAMTRGSVLSSPQRGKSSPKFGSGFSKKKKRGKDNTTVIIASVAGGVALLFIVLLAFFLLSGSEDKPVRAPSPPTAPTAPPAALSLPGQATPQETFETFKQAWVAKDWARVHSLLTPQAQIQMTTVLASMSAMLGQIKPEFSVVAKKHGVEAMDLTSLMMGGTDSFGDEQSSKPDAKSLASQALGAGDKIKDKKSFFIDAMPVFEKFLQSKEFPAMAKMGTQVTGFSLTKVFDMLPMFTPTTKLADVRINGQTATGIAKTPPAATPPGGKEKVTPLKFDQMSGSWYIGAGT